jgi:hypothetical protein
MSQVDSSMAAAGSTCALPQSDQTKEGILSGGCCGEQDRPGSRVMSQSARSARAAAGVGFLILAGAMGSRQLPGGIALWPAAVVPTWFGISHLVAGVTGYGGCPELGAIPSVMLDRQIGTRCATWERIDRAIGA